MDSESKNAHYIAPYPALFIRSIQDAIFKPLLSEGNGLDSSFGDVVEEYIQNVLIAAFHKYQVVKIDGNSERADLYISMPHCDLIIEIKASIGSNDAQSLMKPEHIVAIWERLYKACKQCAASVNEFRQADKPTLALVIVGEEITSEATPFHVFAMQTGLLKDLGIDIIDFLPWNSVEHMLSRTSVENFLSGYVRKWKQQADVSLAQALSFEVEAGEPAHNYEHLIADDKEIFGEEIVSRYRQNKSDAI